ncbi:alpha/beta hydrolase [Lignipirellula cremea]|uniref:Endo-1,4-beta-xylanase Z n=1 Tax=Lignipirellula cremea TaxID=2528010 RepID=A0A518DUB3_9BACT|nr:alpha/beta hydrolase-fold protein [Lignipirellula cremea]QDU95418.1 Endo-1,4-beta-xylanase Z precursor [Lignipirellula cremea]
MNVRMLLTFSLLLAVATPVLAEPDSPQTKQAPRKAPRRGNDDDMWVAEFDPAVLPEGVSHHTYFSEAMQKKIGYCIYLPPGYATDSDQRYPVIYHLHGAGGNEVRTLYNATVLHEGITAGRWPEMIMVFPNGGRATMYQDSADGRYLAETTVIKELLPHIDATYRTVAARQGRCIEGFSMGGRGSTHLAMKFPELFCSLFNQAGNVYPTSQMVGPDYEGIWPTYYLGDKIERLRENDSFYLLEQNLAKIKGEMRIQVACGTQDPTHLPTVRDYHQALVQHEVDHTYFELEGLGHNQKQMVERLKAVWFDYHVESLRRAAEAQR